MEPYLIVFAIAFVSSLALMPVARVVASRVGAIDVPGEHSVHTRPVARTGGLAIVAAFLLATGYAVSGGDPTVARRDLSFGSTGARTAQ